MAQIGNTRALTEGDGLNDYFNVDTVNKVVQLVNGAKLILYADNYATAGATITSSGTSPAVSATAPALAGSGTIATAGVGISRVTPAAAVTGIILAAGTINGQVVHVLNEGAAASSIQFAAVGTSNVADGTNNIIDGLQIKTFIWDANAGTPAWYSYTDTSAGALNSVQSATAPALAGSGTIATVGVGVSRVTPASAVTGIILAAGTIAGQLCYVVNEGTTANSLTFAASGTSNVADGVNNVIFGNQGKLFVWDSSTSLWVSSSQFINGSVASTQSATAPVITNGNTIVTAGVGVARVAPGGAVTGIILGAGTVAGQEVCVVNESAAANTITLNTTPATSNVADSATEAVIPGLKSRKYVWDSATAFWYPSL